MHIKYFSIRLRILFNMCFVFYFAKERLDELEKVNSEGETSLQMGRKHFYGTTLNTVTPCAACKLLRRRCAEECPFSPYFSPHEPQKFAAVHKVFGASNVSKLLMVNL